MTACRQRRPTQPRFWNALMGHGAAQFLLGFSFPVFTAGCILQQPMTHLSNDTEAAISTHIVSHLFGPLWLIATPGSSITRFFLLSPIALATLGSCWWGWPGACSVAIVLRPLSTISCLSSPPTGLVAPSPDGGGHLGLFFDLPLPPPSCPVKKPLAHRAVSSPDHALE